MPPFSACRAADIGRAGPERGRSMTLGSPHAPGDHSNLRRRPLGHRACDGQPMGKKGRPKESGGSGVPVREPILENERRDSKPRPYLGRSSRSRALSYQLLTRLPNGTPAAAWLYAPFHRVKDSVAYQSRTMILGTAGIIDRVQSPARSGQIKGGGGRSDGAEH